MTEFLIAGGLMAGIGVILAAILAFADKKFYVYEDPRIDEVEALLPKANCGACGTTGCRAFAEKAVSGEITRAWRHRRSRSPLTTSKEALPSSNCNDVRRSNRSAATDPRALTLRSISCPSCSASASRSGSTSGSREGA